ncbi:WD repeat-containing protein 61 [Nephila pilipes]|uniref:WD repeat-containing protein 61 n=1 Tax=Nephila pilipes TaxID=299642 RepID=A0A8X6TMZ3_NEPPI|nr:WD repeat-containing protein 61 [Nephila pilipes]
MYSVIFKQEQAHDDSIWCCAWKKSPNAIHQIVTGGVDDMVKSWKWDEEKLDLRHVFEGHALGVVSVDINEDGSGIQRSNKRFSVILFINVLNIYC